MPPISKPEVRFKEGSGIQFLDNGKIRCHGLSKGRMREYREKFNDYATPADDLWPECQCGMAAEAGQYVCRFHGGKTPRTVSAPRTMLDVMPLEMADKFRAVMDSDYLSRKDDINLLQTRVLMLLEELREQEGGEEAWAGVHEALVKLRQGDVVNAVDYLERALATQSTKKEVWKEVYSAQKLLGEMTTTQVKNAKDLQSMATVEQINGLVMGLVHVIHSTAKQYIEDPMLRDEFNRTVVNEIQKLSGYTPSKLLTNATISD